MAELQNFLNAPRTVMNMGLNISRLRPIRVGLLTVYSGFQIV